MPKYDYTCDAYTDHDFELEHPMADCDTLHCCPSCDAPATRVIRKAPTAVFLGPGFACNDSVARPNVGRNPHNQNRHSRG